MSLTAPESTLAVSPSTEPLRMTYEEFLDWLDEDKHAEWVDGEVIMHSPVSAIHSDLNGLLAAALRMFAEQRDAGVVHTEPFLMHLGPDFPGRMPDILFVNREHQDRIQPNLLEGPADLVIEIISPESVARDRGEKFAEYERGGVREYWVLDPIRQQSEFNQLGEDGLYHRVLPDADGIYHSVALPGLWLRVSWLWQRPLPTLFTILREWELI